MTITFLCTNSFIHNSLKHVLILPLVWKHSVTEVKLKLHLHSLIILLLLFSSCSLMSNSLRPHGLQRARPPRPSSTPGTCSNSCPLSRWCHPAVSPSVVPFSCCPQALPASGSFPMGRLFASGGQRIGASASPSMLYDELPTKDLCSA